MVTLHERKQYIVNNDHIATAEETAKLSAEEEADCGYSFYSTKYLPKIWQALEVAPFCEKTMPSSILCFPGSNGK